MKTINTGIFAAIALLTMSFTVAEQAGAFEARTSNPEMCLANVDAESITIGSTTYQQGISVCPTIQSGQCANITLAEEDLECDGEDLFCCAKLETGCTGEQRKIERIVCKE